MDKEFIQNALEVLDASSAVTAGIDIIAFHGFPVASAAVKVIETIANSYLKNKQDRFIEMSSFISSNEELFKKVYTDKDFQDGFIYLFDKYIFERNEEKRKMLREILKGYAESNNFKDFKLERLSNILSLITKEESYFLMKFNNIELTNENTPLLLNSSHFNDEFDNYYINNMIGGLSSLSLVVPGSMMFDGMPYKISDMGIEFIKYIKKD